ncbi:MAG: hypothetical protein JOY65_15210 [Acetobacteraceae bacterium]|nr:hypothetical protein [Acetobacteraceae bacterium]
MSHSVPTKLDAGSLSELLPRVGPSPPAAACLHGVTATEAALERLAAGGFEAEAARLAAHALRRREAVWWACQCALHTAPPDLPPADRAAREAAEEWVRKQTDELRRQAMAQAQAGSFATPEAWAAVAAFWSGGSMAPPDQPAVPPAAHLTGTAVAGAVALAAVRGRPERQRARLSRFLDSAREIARGGAGRLAPEEA